MALEWCSNNKIYLACGGGVFLLYITKKYFSGGVCKSTNRIDGKTVLITGANTGIGKETALDLAKRGGRVIMACRDMKKGQEAAKDVIQKSGNTNVHLKKLDLASLASVRSFAEEILKTEPRLDILVNNAGQYAMVHQMTEDGFEMVFEVNHLSHFLLTNLLLDLLKKSAPSRIVNVSSSGHSESCEVNYDEINNKDKYDPFKAYCQSKLANVLFTRELARRLVGTNVTAFSLHPGVVNTELFRNIPMISLLKVLFYPIIFICAKTLKQGAQTSIHVAVADGVEKHNGKYFADCTLGKVSKAGIDDEMAKQLWDVTVEMVGL